MSNSLSQRLSKPEDIEVFECHRRYYNSSYDIMIHRIESMYEPYGEEYSFSILRHSTTWSVIVFRNAQSVVSIKYQQFSYALAFVLATMEKNNQPF